MLQKLFSWLPIIKLQVVGESMRPTFHDGDFIFANKLSYLFRDPEVGEIVVVRQQGSKKLLVKRIKKRKKDTYFVTGDNPKESTDSRAFGRISKKEIVGKVI